MKGICTCLVRFVLLTILPACFSAKPRKSRFSDSSTQHLVATTKDYEGYLVHSGSTTAAVSRNVRDIPFSEMKPEMYLFRIQSDIKYRYSRTFVTSRVANRNLHSSQEITFRVILPETAFISKFTMEIDNNTYEAYVKPKHEAKRIYDQAKRHGQSSGLVELRNSNTVAIKVNIKPESKVTFNLTYEELLSRKHGRYDQSINVISEQISSVKDVQILVNIEESQNITFLRIPNLRNDLEAQEDIEGINREAVIERPAGNKAKITWSPSKNDRETLSKDGMTGKFVVQYDINRESNSGEILLMEGYFVHFFAPEKLKPQRKHVVFVLDISGSMSGRKLEQMKQAQKIILDDLNPDDFFNIITFSTDVQQWSANDNIIHTYISSEDNIQKAKSFIDRLDAIGGTNIHGSLISAIDLISTAKSLSLNVKSMIFFLTDGEPTEGITDPTEIQERIRTKNRERTVPIFSLGFGTGADFPFLKKLSLQNFGFARKIYEAADATLQLKGFYNEISSLLLSQVVFNYTSPEYIISDVTMTQFPNVFNGSEITISGKITPINERGNSRLVKYTPPRIGVNAEERLVLVDGKCFDVRIHGNGRDGGIEFNTPRIRCQSTHLRNEDACCQPHNVSQAPTVLTPATQEDQFLERLWAYLTIKQLIDKDVLSEPQEDAKNLTTLNEEVPRQQALQLALKYGFVTPLTSLVVVKPNNTRKESNTAANNTASKMHSTEQSTRRRHHHGKVKDFEESSGNNEEERNLYGNQYSKSSGSSYEVGHYDDENSLFEMDNDIDRFQFHPASNEGGLISTANGNVFYFLFTSFFNVVVCNLFFTTQFTNFHFL